MDQNNINDDLKNELNEYERWIDMDWGLNQYEQDDVFPIISMRDDIHLEIVKYKEKISADNLIRLRKLDKKWQTSLINNRDSKFRFNFRNFDEPKTKWWWWIDRLEELTEENLTYL